MYLIFWKIVLIFNSFGANIAWFYWNMFSSCCTLSHSCATSFHHRCSFRCSLASSDFQLSRICWSNWMYGTVHCHLEHTTSMSNVHLPFNISIHSQIYSGPLILRHFQMSFFWKCLQMLLSDHVRVNMIIKTKLRGPSPRANYTDRAAAACWRR
jgi:hypothetical protein